VFVEEDEETTASVDADVSSVADAVVADEELISSDALSTKISTHTRWPNLPALGALRRQYEV
jgi:hypothetical protein